MQTQFETLVSSIENAGPLSDSETRGFGALAARVDRGAAARPVWRCKPELAYKALRGKFPAAEWAVFFRGYCDELEDV